MATMTLGEFERRYGKNKGSVQKQAQAMGFETRNGLDESAIDGLLSYYKIGPYAPMKSAQDRAALGVEVIDGNHREIKTLSVPSFASLERFRTDRVRQELANPTQFVGQVDGFLDELEQCMDLAEAEQERELAQTRQTKRMAQQRIDRFRRRADEYRIKTDILASIQNAELDEIDDLADEVSAMGKPQEPSQNDGLS